MREVSCVERGDRDVEAGLLEAEVGELLGDGPAEFRDDLAPFRRERLAGGPNLCLNFLEFGIEPAQFSVALFQAVVFGLSFRAELDDLSERRAVLSFEGVNQ